jgi:hypothetical protein
MVEHAGLFYDMAEDVFAGKASLLQILRNPL